MRPCGKIAGPILLSVALLAAGHCQDTPPVQQPQSSASDTQTPDTFFEHSQTAKWWVSGQANFIFQANGSFYAQYSGPNSFQECSRERAVASSDSFHRLRIHAQSQIYLDVEETGGSGLSSALGLAGFVNLDVVRNPSIGQAPYIARLFFQQIIPLSDEKIESERNSVVHADRSFRSSASTLRFGKFSLADFFDNNIGGTDSHYQFLNWVIDNNGAYDYAADTRGYTIGAIIELEERNWALRFAETLMPKVANGPNLDADVARARSENIELELRPQLAQEQRHHHPPAELRQSRRHGQLRRSGQALPRPRHSHARRERHRAARNHQVRLRRKLRAGVRGKMLTSSGAGDGTKASMNRSATPRTTKAYEVGVYSRGTNWHRSLDRAGVAFVSSGLSKAHQAYLGLRRPWDLSWATERSITGAKTSRKCSTPRTSGAACSWPAMSSTSTIPA